MIKIAKVKYFECGKEIIEDAYIVYEINNKALAVLLPSVEENCLCVIMCSKVYDEIYDYKEQFFINILTGDLKKISQQLTSIDKKNRKSKVF
jgi:TPP-dependent trihydroxycyclohexane-1,2-dione (THcHDO) dehydratase